MPCKIRAFSTENSDGSYTIGINAKLSKEMQEKAYKHELRHVYKNDFEKESVNEIERSIL